MGLGVLVQALQEVAFIVTRLGIIVLRTKDFKGGFTDNSGTYSDLSFGTRSWSRINQVTKGLFYLSQSPLCLACSKDVREGTLCYSADHRI